MEGIPLAHPLSEMALFCLVSALEPYTPWSYYYDFLFCQATGA